MNSTPHRPGEPAYGVILIAPEGGGSERSVGRNKKATDQQILNAYEEAGSVVEAGKLLGMCGQSVHRRLQKLGGARPINVLTDEERERLRREYITYRDAGNLQELAQKMGRDKTFICGHAKKLGLTDMKHTRTYAGFWKYMSEDEAHDILQSFKCSELTLWRWCEQNDVSELMLWKTMQRFFPGEWEHTIESKASRTTLYRRGRSLEYLVRNDMQNRGYFATRAPMSKGPVDIVAISPGRILMIECKLDGLFGVAHWNDAFDIAHSIGAVPMLAARNSSRGIDYYRLLGRKDGTKRRQPYEPFDPPKVSPFRKQLAGEEAVCVTIERLARP